MQPYIDSFVYMCMNMTKQHKHLTEHLKFNGGSKTICVSTCLSFFGIAPDKYNYTSSNGNLCAYVNVLRRFGYGVRSRKSEFKIANYGSTMTQLRTAIRKSNYKSTDFFIVEGYQRNAAHLMVLDGKGEFVIDTCPKSKWKIRKICQVLPNLLK